MIEKLESHEAGSVDEATLLGIARVLDERGAKIN